MIGHNHPLGDICGFDCPGKFQGGYRQPNQAGHNRPPGELCGPDCPGNFQARSLT